jgi:hypothetical protein
VNALLALMLSQQQLLAATNVEEELKTPVPGAPVDRVVGCAANTVGRQNEPRRAVSQPEHTATTDYKTIVL